MKKIIAVAVLAGFSFSAQAEKMYGVVGVGSASNFGTAFSIAGGMELTQIKGAKPIPVSGEIGYVNLGEKDYGFGVKASATGFYGAAVGRFEINNDLSATAKLGMASMTADATACDPFFGCFSASASSMELVYGAGIDYSLKKSMNMPLSVGAEFNDYGGESVFGARVTLGF